MRLMLVDDEPVILRGLERIIQRSRPEIDVQCFDSPLRALDAISHAVPDLLITDIYMPELDGMEFIRRAKALGCARVVLLSGHSEFEIARQAMRLQSMDYLLKPIQKGELFPILDAVERELRVADAHRTEDTSGRLRLMVLYGISSGEFGALPPSAGDGRRAALALWRNGEPPAGSGIDLYDLGVDESGWRLTLAASADEGALMEWVARARRAGARCEEAGPPDTLHPLYMRLRATDAAEALKHVLDAPDDVERARRLTGFLESSELPARELCACLSSLAAALDLRWDLWARVRFLVEWRDSADREAYALRSLRSLPEGRPPESAQVAEMIDYIRVHYAEDLTLAAIAAQFCLQPNYFSALFHRGTGETFNRSLQRVRVEKACEALLRDPDRALEAVCADVGVPNQTYFFRLFRDHTAMTPREFCALSRRLVEERR